MVKRKTQVAQSHRVAGLKLQRQHIIHHCFVVLSLGIESETQIRERVRQSGVRGKRLPIKHDRSINISALILLAPLVVEPKSCVGLLVRYSLRRSRGSNTGRDEK